MWGKEMSLIQAEFQFFSFYTGASQEALAIKNLSANKETQQMQAQSRGWEDPLEEEMATHSSILAWKTAWAEEPGGL